MSEIDKLGGKIQWLEEQIAEKDARIAFMASNDYVYSLTSEIEKLKLLLKGCAAIMENGLAVTPEFITDLRKAAE